MNDREKLIALITDAFDKCVSVSCVNCKEYDRNEKISDRSCQGRLFADHLIANGVVVREKGEWEIIRDDYDNELMRCPYCREEFYDGENDTVDHTPNFCPNCGADMRVEEQNRSREGENG